MRIFVSYSHDSDVHGERVLRLTEQLRCDGLDAVIDQYLSSCPVQGWPNWMMDELDRADRVLIVCTETYHRRFRGHETPGIGLGARWEGALITQALYEAVVTQKSKFIPVLFDTSDHEWIPVPLRARTHYDVSTHAGYGLLYDALLEQGGIAPRSLGTVRVKPRKSGPAIVAGPGAPNQTARYLRRRARAFPRGSALFQTLMLAFMQKRFTTQDAYARFESHWPDLRNPYEKVMAQAAYLESRGEIEQMRDQLTNARFSGRFEGARLLYESIACEKLDDLPRAQRLLRTVLDAETDKKLLRAAQFNVHVCYEKSHAFESVDFEAFFEDTADVCIDGERLADKAIAMHMIVCIKQGSPFMHKRVLQESLDFLQHKNATGYAKTLLTKLELDKVPMTPDAGSAILGSVKYMDANSKQAILVRVGDYLPKDAISLRKLVADELKKEIGQSSTLQKWKPAGGKSKGGGAKSS